MAVTVNTNVSAMNAQRFLNSAGTGVADSMQKLSSGMRINSAKDDAAGLQISNRLTSQTNGLNVAMRNVNDGMSIAQTAEGAMQESTNILQRMRDLSLQSANGSNSDGDRKSLQKEMTALKAELTRISETTTFGGQNLLDGSYGTQDFQIGANANETLSMTLNDVAADAIGNYSLDLDGTQLGQAAAAAATPGVNTVAGGQTIDIVGDTGSDTVNVTAGDSAADIANKINNSSSLTGVSAEAKTGVKLDNLSTAGTVGLNINGKSISANIADTSDLSKLAEAINDKSGTLGVKAELAGGGSELILTNETGDDIALEFSDGSTSTTFDASGLLADGTFSAAQTLTDGSDDSTVVSGTLSLSSNNGFTATSDATINDVATAEAATLDSVDLIDITSATGAQDAIKVIDAAIGSIDDNRADLGAIQNRLGFTLNNLANINENVSASNSRIRDVDFAKETTNLTKNQILQQASTAILAQAKQIPQAALSLLG